MSARTIPGPRTQLVECETCGTRLPHLLADCVNALCLAASIGYAVREQQRIEAADDE